MTDHETFVTAHTTLRRPAIVPELLLQTTDDVMALWQATEDHAGREGLAPPFWAIAWPGGQALARYLLDHAAIVRGRSVLDFAAGGGVASLAAALACARSVTATELDPLAVTAIRLNAAAAGLTVEARVADAIDTDEGWDVVLVGDTCYERSVAARMLTWLQRLRRRGALVLLGDPGRAFLPREHVRERARYVVPTDRGIEDHDERHAAVWEFTE
jgi:predicted nicotinamide N-methyase